MPKPKRTELEIENDERRDDEVFLFREPIVLLTILCLALSQGMTLALHNIWLTDVWMNGLIKVWVWSAAAVPVIGIVFSALLSELHGRKLIFIICYSLSIVSSILFSLPWQEIAACSVPIHYLVRGSSFVFSPLAITEYCSPKHRFTYLLLNSFVFRTVHSLTSILFKLLGARTYPYALLVVVVLLACLVSVRKWPESPYWLASKGKLEDSKEAFLWLRGEEGRMELNSVMKEHRSPGPFKLYWTSFIVAIATLSVILFTDVGGKFWFKWASIRSLSRPKDELMEEFIRLGSSTALITLVVILSYFVRRRVLFILVTGVSALLSYGITIWMLVDPTVEDPSNQLFYFAFFVSNIVAMYGPTILGLILCIEIIPVKYNTHMACAVMLCEYIYTILVWLWSTTSDVSRFYLPLFTTLSLVGVIVYYCYAPDTKDKTLLEIQKLYTPELSEQHSKEDHEIVTHM